MPDKKEPQEIFATLTCAVSTPILHGKRVRLHASTNEVTTEDNTFSKSDKPSLTLIMDVTNPEFQKLFTAGKDYTLTIAERYP